MDKLLSITKAANLLGMSSKWLRQKDHYFGLTVYRLKGGHRRYSEKELLMLKEKSVSGKTLKVE